MEDRFWKGKKVLVTGANGFIGSNLTAQLVQRGARVIAFVHNRNDNRHPLFYPIEKDVVVVEGDVRDFDVVMKAFSDHSIDTAFHLAAQPIVSAAFENPLPTFEINILGTIHVLEAARRSSALKRLVIASTTHVYGDNKNLPYLESYFPQPSRPYETSKTCADILAQTYYYTYGLPVAISRFTNTYGPGDMNFSRIVPKTIKSVIDGWSPEIVGGTSKRDYMFVGDAVRAYLILAEALHRPEIKGQAFNFGSGEVLSAVDVADAVIRASGRTDLSTKIIPAAASKEIPEQYVSIDKAKSLLGWAPMHMIDAGLKKTVEWYRTI